jgi:hypothetical protein
MATPRTDKKRKMKDRANDDPTHHPRNQQTGRTKRPPATGYRGSANDRRPVFPAVRNDDG